MLKSIVCHCHLFLIEVVISRHLWCFHWRWCYPSHAFHMHFTSMPSMLWWCALIKLNKNSTICRIWPSIQWMKWIKTFFLWMCYWGFHTCIQITHIEDSTHMDMHMYTYNTHTHIPLHMEMHILKWSLLYGLITFIPSIFWLKISIDAW